MVCSEKLIWTLKMQEMYFLLTSVIRNLVCFVVVLQRSKWMFCIKISIGILAVEIWIIWCMSFTEDILRRLQEDVIYLRIVRQLWNWCRILRDKERFSQETINSRWTSSIWWKRTICNIQWKEPNSKVFASHYSIKSMMHC